MIELLVRLVSLVVFIACVERELPSRMMEIPKTTIKGAQAVRGPKGLIMGMVCKIAIARK
jgi:hypothetical protein